MRASRTKRTRTALFGCVLVALVGGCTNTPPPPVVTSPVAESSPPTSDIPAQIVVGVDEVSGGYNPHNLADVSTTTSALGQLLLPSVFRQTAASEGTDQETTAELDENLMRSAKVTSYDPFTVTYDIRPDASWSDGAPIAVEDFVYLANAMRDEPGTVQPAGYRLISNIQPGEGGKRVEVTFRKPYPAWRTLFNNLLPAHLLKDVPGGWNGALESSFPAYGGPFAIKKVDKDLGEIILERNERYWSKPAAVDRLVLRRSDQPGMAAALRSGNDQFALARTDATGVQLFGELGPDVSLDTVARPETASVLLRPAGEPLSDDRVRSAVAALIDRDKLIDEGAQGGPSAELRADAQVRPPAAQGYAPTMPEDTPPAVRSEQQAQRQLTAAGYERVAGQWSKDGQPLSLVIAAPGQREPYASIAKEMSEQLVAAGVDVRVINPTPRELFGDMLANSADRDNGPTADDGAGGIGVDIAVAPQPVGGDPATVLASTFGCGSKPDSGSGNPPSRGANPAAFCDPELQPTIRAALTGAVPLSDALSELEPRLWRRDVVIPLFQVANTLAIGPGVSGVHAGPPMVSPFGSAVDWIRRPR